MSLSTPFRITEHRESFEVKTADCLTTICYLYFEDEKSHRDVMGRMTKDQAERFALAIARLPDYDTELSQ